MPMVMSPCSPCLKLCMAVRPARRFPYAALKAVCRLKKLRSIAKKRCSRLFTMPTFMPLLPNSIHIHIWYSTQWVLGLLPSRWPQKCETLDKENEQDLLVLVPTCHAQRAQLPQKPLHFLEAGYLLQVPQRIDFDSKDFAQQYSAGADIAEMSVTISNGAGQKVVKGYLAGKKQSYSVSQRLWYCPTGQLRAAY